MEIKNIKVHNVRNSITGNLIKDGKEYVQFIPCKKCNSENTKIKSIGTRRKSICFDCGHIHKVLNKEIKERCQ